MNQLKDMQLSVIGGGKMGETLISSLLESKNLSNSQIVVADPHMDRVKYLTQNYQIKGTTDNLKAIKTSTIILLCIKPQAIEEVLEEISRKIHAGQLVISIVASVTTDLLEDLLAKEVPVIRAMPNTPCLIKRGMTILCAGKYATEIHMKQAVSIFKKIGRTLILEEEHMDAVTGLSASGPAFIYVVIESMAEGGVKVGLPRNIATELAAQAVLGAACMVLETEDHPAMLKDAVTTPAGCTIDGLMELEEGGLRVTLIKTIVKATERATQLINTK